MTDQSLRELIKDGLVEITSSDSHTLSPINRRKIYDYIKVAVDQPHIARAFLDYLAVLKVRPLLDFHRDYIHEYGVDQCISIIKAVVDGTTPHAEGMRIADSLSERLLKEIDSSEPEEIPETGIVQAMQQGSNPEFVIFAVLEALYCSLGICRFDSVIITIETRDTDFDIWSSDTARWAVLAYAGDELSGGVDLKRRKEFWQWWLNEAVPVAYKYRPFTEHHNL